MKRSFIILFLATIGCNSFSINEFDNSTNKNQDISINTDSSVAHFIQKRIHQVMKKKHLPAFSVAIVDHEEIKYMKTFGVADIGNNIPASNETVFKIWSVAKVFTAMEIFREAEEGLIDLDQPITEYLPDFRIQNRFNDEKPVTIRNILAHRSGLPRNECTIVADSVKGSDSLVRFEKATADCNMAFPAETRYHYSNLGYDLLGRIIEQIRGDSFSSYMKISLLNDLAMRNSTFISSDLKDHVIKAKGYDYYKNNLYPMEQLDINSIPSGNLYSTIQDLSEFLKAAIGNQVFKDKETMSQMFKDHFSKMTDPETMGLGWKTSKVFGSELMIWHDGGPSEGIGALIAILPYRKIGIALIGTGTSFDGNVAVPLALEIFNSLIEKGHGFKYDQPDQPDKIKPDNLHLKRYTGKYIAFGQIMDVKKKHGKLKGRIAGIRLDLIPVSETEFRVTHWMDKIGLTKIFKPPIEFDKIKIRFYDFASTDSCNMIINLDNISFEICPKYPDNLSLPDNWGFLTGEYQMAERLPSNKPGKLSASKFSISLEDNVLVMSNPFGPIVPQNNFITITSGPFAGETIEYDHESGNIIHQNAVFIPLKVKN